MPRTKPRRCGGALALIQYSERMKHGERNVEDGAQGEPHPERRRHVEADEGESAGENHRQHGRHDAKAHRKGDGERRGCDRGDAGHGRVKADHRGGMAAALEDDAE